MDLSTLTAISPVDGRYAEKANKLRDLFSEYGLIRHRVLVEIRWLQHLAQESGITELTALSADTTAFLDSLVATFDAGHAARIKEIEGITNHDVKAVEHFINEQIRAAGHADAIGEFVHFACTSEDINNVSYGLMISTARERVLLPEMGEIETQLCTMAREYASLPMMARTHGQMASPTTLGKELAVFAWRLRKQKEKLDDVKVLGKMNGAVGNYHAHLAAYPSLDWEQISEQFVISLGLNANQYTTQIDSHDWLAEFCHSLMRFNTILLDLTRDVWGYISLGYFRQQSDAAEVGSSTMPHKINPIDFENAEGNLGLANAQLQHLADKLPISRWQRDLSDSTVQRNIGTALAFSVIAWDSCRKGLARLEPDVEKIKSDLVDAWEVMAEPIQTVMRRYGIENPYQQLKALTRGKSVDANTVRCFIENLDIPDEARNRLLDLSPAGYTGSAARQASKI